MTDQQTPTTPTAAPSGTTSTAAVTKVATNQSTTGSSTAAPAKSSGSDICGECYPDGWPTLEHDAPATTARCPHGEWSRPAPKGSSS